MLEKVQYDVEWYFTEKWLQIRLGEMRYSVRLSAISRVRTEPTQSIERKQCFKVSIKEKGCSDVVAITFADTVQGEEFASDLRSRLCI